MAFLDEHGLAEVWSIINRWGLTEATKRTWGFGADAVPNDVFSCLGPYNQHWWEVTRGIARNVYSEKQTEVTERTDISYYTNSQSTFEYAASVSINPHDGSVSLVNPQTITLSTHTLTDLTTACATLAALAPMYFIGAGIGSGAIYYIPEGATAPEAGSREIGPGGYTFYVRESGGGNRFMCIGESNAGAPAYEVTTTAKWVTAGEVSYVQGATRDAYTDGVTEDFDSYVYLGIPFQNMPTAAKITHGSYVGTGTYGEANPNSLTFDFEPKLVVVNSRGYGCTPIIMVRGASGTYINDTSNSYAYISLSWGEKTVSWYCGEGAEDQANSSGTAYHYIAIC